MNDLRFAVRQLLTQDFGFNPEQVVTMNIHLPRKNYPDQSDSQRLFDQLLARVRALPGAFARWVRRNGAAAGGNRTLRRAGLHRDPADAGDRKERRVGKECELKCRSRWSPYH